MMRRLFLMFVLALTLGVITQTAFAQQGRQDIEILDEYEVRPDSLIVTVTATGVVEPARSVDLSFETSAPVSIILVQEGDSVDIGDALAQLESSDLESALREAEIALELQQLAYQSLIDPPRDVDVVAAQSAVAAAEAAVPAAGFGPTREQIRIAELQAELARNQLWQTQLNRDRLLDLNPEFRGGYSNEIKTLGGVTAAEYAASIAESNIAVVRSSGGGIGAIASAEAQLVRAQIALENLLNGPDELDLLKFEIQLDQAELAVEQARVALDRAILIAPFDGVVAQSNLTVGELPPQGGAPAMQIVDTSFYYVDLAIDESDVVNVELGQSVSLRLDALPESDVQGRITRLSVTPDPENAVVVYRARVTLDPTDAPIRVGMSTTATITTRELQDVLVLPNRFIRIDRETSQAYVTVQRGEGQFEEIPVELGERNNNVSQIVSGIEPGQRVIQLPRDTLDLQGVLEASPN